MKGRTSNEQFRRQLDEMVGELRHEIMNGTYGEGDRLPSEKQLAVRFGVGNLSVRKGLEELVREGLVEKVPRVGNRVRKRHSRSVVLRVACTAVIWRNIDFEGLLARFSEAYPGIRVEHVSYDWNMQDISHYDLVFIGEIQFGKLTEQGQHTQLQPLEDWPDAYPVAAEQYTFDNRLYLRPLTFSPIVLFYNRRHFHECGLHEPDGSWTWADLIRAGERLSEGQGRSGFAFHVPDINRWPVFLLQSGEQFQWDGGRLRSLKGTGLLDSLRLLRDLFQNHKLFPMLLSERNRDHITLFREGKLSMILGSYMGMNELRSMPFDQGETAFDVAPIPYFREPRTLVISLGAGVGANAASPEEAHLLLDYMTSVEGQSWIRQKTTSIPSLRSLPEPARAKLSGCRPSRYALYREIMAGFRSHGDLNVPVSRLERIIPELKAFLANLIDEDELDARLIERLSNAP